MRNLIAILITITFSFNVAFANCDFATGITENADSTYTYTLGCHLRVGQDQERLRISLLLNKTLEQALKEEKEALAIANKRIELWKSTSEKLEDKVVKMEKLQKKNGKLMLIGGFVLGVLAYSLIKK